LECPEPLQSTSVYEQHGIKCVNSESDRSWDSIAVSSFTSMTFFLVKSRSSDIAVKILQITWVPSLKEIFFNVISSSSFYV
jgi:hypothetical protein